MLPVSRSPNRIIVLMPVNVVHTKADGGCYRVADKYGAVQALQRSVFNNVRYGAEAPLAPA